MSALTRQFSNLVTSLRSRGVRETLVGIYVGYFKANSFLVLHLELPGSSAGAPVAPDVELRQVSLEELRTERARHTDLPFEFFGDETFGFKTPFVAFVNGELAAIQWLIEPGEFSRFLNLQSDEVEINYTSVRSKFRGRRLNQVLMQYLVNTARARGRSRAFCIVHVVNIQMFKPMMDIGFRPVETLTHFSVFRPKANLAFVKR